MSERIPIGQAAVHVCSFSEAVDTVMRHAESDKPPAFVVTPNAQHIVLLESDARLRAIYADAHLVVADGVSLLLAARLIGRELPERVTGVDLFQKLCGVAAERGLAVFLLGGKEGSAELAASKLTDAFPGLQVQFYCPPMGFERSAEELGRTAGIVREANPALLFVGLGAPKQEYWIHEHGLQLGARVCIGIGGSFEMVGGVVRRAPRWVQSSGCEWLYRFLREPRRMWRRYLVGNMQFAHVILRQVLNGA